MALNLSSTPLEAKCIQTLSSLGIDNADLQAGMYKLAQKVGYEQADAFVRDASAKGVLNRVLSGAVSLDSLLENAGAGAWASQLSSEGDLDASDVNAGHLFRNTSDLEAGGAPFLKS